MKYEFEYRPDTPYGHMVQLLRDHVEPGAVIDLGCGNAAIAEPLIELGFSYIGIDVDPTALTILTERGLEVHHVDLTDTSGLADTIERIAAGRHVVAITALDVIEHLNRPLATLDAIRTAMGAIGSTWLGVSIPNVTHRDLAAKLVAGRWDVTPTGLLDETHVSLYSAHRLAADMTAAGFAAGPHDDFEMLHSDQSFPADLTTLSHATPLGRLLRHVRAGADDHATTNQFVRLFTTVDVPERGPDARGAEGAGDTFLTVMVRTRGTRATLADTLLCLAGQTVDDFEVLLLVDTTDDDAHRHAIAQLEPFDTTFRDRVTVERLDDGNRVAGLNRGVELARGRYLVALDDDDLVFANWVEAFADTVAHAGGAIVRSGCVVQRVVRSTGTVSDVEPVSGFSLPYAETFDFIDHLRSSQTPLHSTAFPIQVFRSLGIRYNPVLPVYEDLDVLLRAAAWCGVIETGEITAIYRRWDDAEATIHAVPWREWEIAKHRILHDLDREPLLLPEGSASRLFNMNHELHVQRERAEAAEAAVAAMQRSRFWRATAPLRAVARLVRPRS